MRIVFFSDSHLGFDQPVSDRARRPCRGADFFANFQRVLAYAADTRVEMVIHGGDFFFRSRVHQRLVDRAYQMLFEFAERDIPILIVPGNHERSVMPASLFLNHPNIHIFHSPQTKVFERRGMRINVTGFPYVPHVRSHFTNVVTKARSEARCADVNLLCFHHAVDGATVGPGDFTFRHRPDTVAAEQLPRGFDLILSGHIHRHQILKLPTPVLYCGSIERTSFAEAGETKGFCEIKFSGLTGRGPKIDFHPLPTRSMVTIDGRAFTTEPELMTAILDAAADLPANAITRLQLNAYPTQAMRRELARHLPGIVQFAVRSAGSSWGTRRMFDRS